ncbi:MAG: signal transduction histidine kinase/ActR/RegA family two-component response regulator [Candidatus Azotimanducaceae bacterium]|jgi:signal transduction histidine kinase/ActR/RegA family two-component response regulator
MFGGILILAAVSATTNSLLTYYFWETSLSETTIVMFRWFVSDTLGALALAPLLFYMKGIGDIRCFTRGLSYSCVALGYLWILSLNELSILSEAGAIVLLVTPTIIYLAITATRVTLYSAVLFLSLGSVALVLARAHAKEESDIVEVVLFQIVMMGTAMIINAIRNKTLEVTETLENEREMLEKRIQQRTSDLNLAKQKAELADSAKSDFLANMSHEIRTPLNGVVGMAQVLADDNLNEDQLNQVEIIISSGNAVCTILNDVLDLSKIEAGKLEIEKLSDSLDHTLELVHSLFLNKTTEKNLCLNLELDPNIPNQLKFDPARLRQCLSNLVSNAIKFTEVGSITISARILSERPESFEIEIVVTDTGIGVAEQAQSKLFDAFSQAESSTSRKYGGTGLGLTITKQLVELMNGDIQMKSELGCGSEFRLRLPFEKTAQLAKAATENVINSDLAGMKILVVDDNQVNRIVASAMLKQLNSVTETADNGKEALAILNSKEIDLVLLDIHMPVMNGPETIRHIRQSDQPWSQVPVIALSADAMSGNAELFAEMGMNGFVSKPIDKALLAKEILSASAVELLPRQ